jgi:glutamine synthetase
MSLENNDVVLAEYVWIGGSGQDLRSKTKTIVEGDVKDCSELPVWNFDGSSTGQAPGDDSEVYLKPVRIFKDPFRQGNNILVMCECLTPQGDVIPTNTRADALEIFEEGKDQEPWFGIEQEYTLLESDGRTPFGWPRGGFPGPQGPYYCGAGTGEAIGRWVANAHYNACLYAGINVSGINGEVMASQWEYQVGPCTGIDSGDQLWMSRYIMTRVCEEFGIKVSFHPKPIKGDWNGAGCHTNFSTKSMREEGGYDVILKCMEKLEKVHAEHIEVYGADNDQRLTGLHETARIDQFSFGVANRGASIRIPRTTEADGKGYFEDRRPASNMDPYVVTSKLFQTCCL